MPQKKPRNGLQKQEIFVYNFGGLYCVTENLKSLLHRDSLNETKLFLILQVVVRQFLWQRNTGHVKEAAGQPREQ